MFLQSNEHVGTPLRRRQSELIQPRQSLEGDLDCEVLVVGAGSAAAHTRCGWSKADARYASSEASRIATGAPGATAGRRCPAGPATCRRWRAASATRRRTPSLDGMLWAAGEMRELPQRHGFDCDYWSATYGRRSCRAGSACSTTWQAEANRRWGYEGYASWRRTELPEWIASERYPGP